MNEWSLDALYTGFDDEKLAKDICALKRVVERINQFAKSMDKEDEIKTCRSIIELQEEMVLLNYRLIEYFNLRQSVNTQDAQAVSALEQVNQICADASKSLAGFQRFIVEMKDLEKAIQEDPLLHEYAFYLHEIQENGTYLLSDEVEEVIAKMDLSGGYGWSSLQSYLTSTVEVDYEGKKLNLSQIRNLAYDPDSTTRKKAYEAELASYDKIRDAIAFSLNNIKAQVNTICDLRGYKSPLDLTLHQSRLKQSTLDALLAAMQEFMPIFHKYLKQKAKLLGYKNGLPWYELFAPLGKSDKKYSIDQAKEYLVNHFKPFSSDMAQMMERAFDEEWIDFYPRNGKVGGAFCANLPFLKQSRILTNYDGSLGDIVTLAHELGHAYHGMMIEDHRILNTNYSMPIAETASTFNENIIMNALIEESTGDEKLALIENQLQDLTQTICDIYSRFLFEQEVFVRRKKGFMFADELADIMCSAQKKAYGDGLDPKYLHPYMWVCKSHYYSSDLSFYNFPYAFGSLFARGLYVKYQRDGSTFVDQYRELLHATTIYSIEDVAQIANIDISDPTFWKSALKTCEDRINEFIDLSDKKAEY